MVDPGAVTAAALRAELAEAHALHRERHAQLGSTCFAASCPDGAWLQLIHRLLDGQGIRS